MQGLQAWEMCNANISFKSICNDLKAGDCLALTGVREHVSKTCSDQAAASLQGVTVQRGNKLLKAANDFASVSATSLMILCKTPPHSCSGHECSWQKFAKPACVDMYSRLPF